jgi:hypothetical protein
MGCDAGPGHLNGKVVITCARLYQIKVPKAKIFPKNWEIIGAIKETIK